MFSFIDTPLCLGPFLIVIDDPAISCSGAWTKSVGSYSCITGASPQSQHSGPLTILISLAGCHFTGQRGHYVLADLNRINTSRSLSPALRFTKCPLVHLGPRRDPETPETLGDIPDIKRLPSVQTAVIRLHLIMRTRYT